MPLLNRPEVRRALAALSTLPGRAAALWRTVREYVGVGARRRSQPVRDRAGLRSFLDSRASFVAQTSLYGYLRTRTGMRFPELFDDDPFVRSINIAKWHIWLACLSDLAVYTGGMLASMAAVTPVAAGRLVQEEVHALLEATGIPADAGDEFAAHVQRVRARMALCDWANVRDDEGVFIESPSALVQRAPVIEEFMRLDEAIVRNSVRFRWQEVRRDLRASLDARAVIADGA